jgi:hypothetical protein
MLSRLIYISPGSLPTYGNLGAKIINNPRRAKKTPRKINSFPKD